MTTSPSAHRTQLVLLFLALFNSILGLSILFPILPPLGRKLGLGEIQIGWISAGYSLMHLLASPWWGKQSERIGRRPVLLAGIWGYSGGFAAFAGIAHLGLSGVMKGLPLFVGLLLCRVVTGSLSAATFPSAQAYIADVTPRERRTSGMAVIGAAFGLAVVLGPAIGAGLATFGLLVPLFASIAVALLDGLFVFLLLPEPERHAPAHDLSDNPTRTIRLVWPLLAVGMGLTLATVALEQTAAFLYQDVLHLTPQRAAQTVGIALTIYGLGAVAAQMLLMRKRTLAPRRSLIIGDVLMALGLIGTALAGQFWTLTATLLVQGFAQGLAMPSLAAELSLSVPDDRQGTIAGLNSASQALGRTLGPILGTTLYTTYHRGPFWGGGALAAILVLVLVLLPAGTPRTSLGQGT